MRVRLNVYTAVSGVLAAMMVLLVGACGGQAASPIPTTAVGPQVRVELGEWYIRPNVPSAPAGAVTFAATILGLESHELVVIKTDLPADGLKLNASNQVDEGASGLVLGEIEPEDFGPGKAASSTLTLPSGGYVLFCNEPGHYQKGMHASLQVVTS